MAKADIDTKIIELFKKNTGVFLSGEDISDILGCTRAAVWKHCEKLRDIGYDIEAVPHLGYRLKGIPDKMLPDEILYELDTVVIGQTIYTYTKTGSTNTLAYTLAEQGAPEGTVVIAEQQENGKGRLGRPWVSPPGGIYLSCIIKPTIAPNEIQEFTLVTALSVVDAVKEVTGIVPRIKWPNDIVINGKKVAGILTEMKAETDRIAFVVVGIGVNVNTAGRSLPSSATSLKEETGERVMRLDICRALIRNLDREYRSFREKGFRDARGRVIALSATIGKKVRVVSHIAVHEGTAVDIDEEGALVLKTTGDGIQRIVSGDVN
ncbi:MAG: biotin--[acetyl-CoA-carboxylase] ligase [Candidatus Omnitrophica bacterium]|nr:biotin--[acetyl-CoA-carboxylase] ligase [Candidatus Omnitrophota bacterium]